MIKPFVGDHCYAIATKVLHDQTEKPPRSAFPYDEHPFSPSVLSGHAGVVADLLRAASGLNAKQPRPALDASPFLVVEEASSLSAARPF